jgi:hypothetical protein
MIPIKAHTTHIGKDAGAATARWGSTYKPFYLSLETVLPIT